MFAYIQGQVAEITPDAVILDVSGIGYFLRVTNNTLSRLPKKGETTKLYTYMQVKEDGISLFGFLSQEELNMFKLLVSVSGIGPKVASSILAALSPEQIVTAVVSEDAVMLSKAPGVGKKTAARITLELQDKIRKKDAEYLGASAAPSVASADKQDAIDALMALGYSGAESLKAVLAAAEEDMPAAEIIRRALKHLNA